VERIEVLVDVVQGLFVCLETFTAPGEGVVVQTPVYPPFLMAVADTSRRLVRNGLVRGSAGFEMDLEALRGAIDRETRVLMLCNPQNPTGRVFTREELEALAEVVLEHDLVVLSDEIHADLTYPGVVHVPFASLASELAERTVTLHSATKAFNIAGLRCAVAAFGSEALQQRFHSMPRKLRGGLDSFGAAATRIAWRECQPWLAELMTYLDGNRQRIAGFLAERLPAVGHVPPEATYLAWLDCRGLELPGASPFEFFLEHALVAGQDGARFGPDGEGWLRLNFATSRAVLDEALERMANAVDAL
jgi:cystathionine beta-lyase